jgi:hypothetical protein
MKEITALKLTCVSAFVATLGVGCASSGYARYDADRTDMDQGVGVSASADVGTDSDTTVIRRDLDRDVVVRTDVDNDPNVVVRTDLDRNADAVVLQDPDGDEDIVVADTEGEERVTVSALSFTPETRATWVNKFPFYDRNYRLRTIDVYTFAVPDDIDLDVDDDNDREFRASMPAGTVFVEAAGGAGEVRSGKIIQHSPSPTR